MKVNLPKIIVILGPTATGKSDLAVDIAKKYKGEVVSADSRQVYRGFDIGSGKITKKEMKGVPHHLLDIVEPKKIYNVEQYKNDAGKSVADILARKKLPIIAGGTGFYIDALVLGEEFPNVPPNKALRAKLENKTLRTLMKEITKLDPKRAKTLDQYNKVRIIRAIEIARSLGSVPKVKQTRRYNPLFIGLTLPTEKLRENIHIRLLKRMKGGKMEREISNLHKNGLSWKRLNALGLEYRYISLYLQKKMNKETMLVELEREIAQYARRQKQWFKRNKDIKWFTPNEKPAVLEQVRNFLLED